MPMQNTQYMVSRPVQSQQIYGGTQVIGGNQMFGGGQMLGGTQMVGATQMGRPMRFQNMNMNQGGNIMTSNGGFF
jgi:hypothetical protein